MSIKVHLPSMESHGSHGTPRSLASAAPAARLGCAVLGGMRGGGRVGAHGCGGEAELPPPCCCQQAPGGLHGISIIIFFFKASLMENYKLIC